MLQSKRGRSALLLYSHACGYVREHANVHAHGYVPAHDDHGPASRARGYECAHTLCRLEQHEYVNALLTCLPPPYDYRSQFFTVLGNGITSLIFPIPVRYITQRSNPRPNPE